MLTSILSAACALTLSTSAAVNPTDTLNLYILNGVKVVNFDGSQLVGKTISDYKIITATNNRNGVVTKVHNICTDGKQAKFVSVAGEQSESGQAVTVRGSDPAIVIINGKQSTREEMVKLNPRKIAEMQIYKAGTKEALKLTEDKNMNVIVIKKK